METSISTACRRCEIRAGALVEPVAGEGLELDALYRPLAVVCRRDAAGRRETRLLDPKRHVFRNDADAIRFSIAPARRCIDTTPAGTLSPCVGRS
ncbi:hypothetical protein [Burkholderia dolosa]|uniref:hypothetical protein n=1 Tax=Burkholderia dolosa TaxID=152500 RepID=UPI0015909D40|nr:hypothetical protein [Burkholderia dolosa]MBR8059441.1 hypothetical protein [Burkholderia dolosa]MBY4752881.1 hypothetical protein [Burkholderia dolosa]